MNNYVLLIYLGVIIYTRPNSKLVSYSLLVKRVAECISFITTPTEFAPVSPSFFNIPHSPNNFMAGYAAELWIKM